MPIYCLISFSQLSTCASAGLQLKLNVQFSCSTSFCTSSFNPLFKSAEKYHSVQRAVNTTVVTLGMSSRLASCCKGKMATLLFAMFRLHFFKAAVNSETSSILIYSLQSDRKGVVSVCFQWLCCKFGGKTELRRGSFGQVLAKCDWGLRVLG